MGNWTSTFSAPRLQRAARVLRRQQALDSRPTSRTSRAAACCSRPTAANGLNGRVRDASATRARTSARPASRGSRASRTRYIIDNFSFLMGQHQFKAGRAAVAPDDVHGRRGVAQGTLDVPVGPGVQHQRSDELPEQFSGNVATGKATLTAWSPSVYIQDTWQPTGQPHAEPRRAVRPRPDAGDGQLGTSRPTTSGSSSGWAARRRSRDRSSTRTTSRRALGFVWVPTSRPADDDPRQLRVLLRPEPLQLDRHLSSTRRCSRRGAWPSRATTPAENPFCAANPSTCTAISCGRSSRRASRRIRISRFAPYGTEQILGVAPNFKIPYSGTFSVGVTHEFDAGPSTCGPTTCTRALYDGAVAIDTNWTQTADGRYVAQGPAVRARSGSSATSR